MPRGRSTRWTPAKLLKLAPPTAMIVDYDKIVAMLRKRMPNKPPATLPSGRKER